MFEVELDIFSGRPNPRWTLSPDEEKEFLARLSDGSVPMVALSKVEDALGYRGFIVRASGATAGTLAARGLPAAFRVRDGLGRTLDFTSESWLLYSAAPVNIASHVVEAAQAGLSVAADPSRKCKAFLTSTTDFSDWNNPAWVGENNCYNYASNWRTDTFAQPGRGAGDMYHGISAPEIHDAAARDGYTDACVGGRTLNTGYCIWPGTDYHWYRQTQPVSRQVRWCHKPGGTPARNYDESGNPITDPATCDRGPYTIWGGFMFYQGKHNKIVR